MFLISVMSLCEAFTGVLHFNDKFSCCPSPILLNFRISSSYYKQVMCSYSTEMASELGIANLQFTIGSLLACSVDRFHS